MNFNKGKYEPKVVKETIQGKEIKCNINGIDKDTISLIIGNDFVFKILFATFDIDPEGYYWELSVVPVNPNTKEVDVEKMKSCLITDLDVIDNFFDQCN
jgi:hypothetical protein